MRPSRRYFLPKKLWFAVLLVAAFARPASNQTALPRTWSDGVNALADRIAAMVSPTKPVGFSLKNISSLDAADADVVRAALETQLAQHHFHLSHAATVETHIDVTLSDSSDTYMWVAQVRNKGDMDSQEPEIAVVSVAKATGPGSAKAGETLTIHKTLVWSQAAKFFDFKITGDSASPTLLVLEPARLSIYAGDPGKWVLVRELAINHKSVWPRDVRGSFGEAIGQPLVLLPGVSCSGDASDVAKISCSAAPAASGPPATSDAKPISIPGHDTGEAVMLRMGCDDSRVALASGTGDWTQPDSVRGFLIRGNQTSVPGPALDFDGPVIALIAADAEGLARAIVLNLKTGDYEGYSVAATCSQ
jgi:hypothetical protein